MTAKKESTTQNITRDFISFVATDDGIIPEISSIQQELPVYTNTVDYRGVQQILPDRIKKQLSEEEQQQYYEIFATAPIDEKLGEDIRRLTEEIAALEIELSYERLYHNRTINNNRILLGEKSIIVQKLKDTNQELIELKKLFSRTALFCVVFIIVIAIVILL